MKICTKCKINKLFKEFYKCKSHTDGLRSHCIQCVIQHRKQIESININPYINIFKKLCPNCNIEKDCTEFFTQKSNKDGLRSWCKVCHTQNCLKYNKLNKDKVLKTIRERIFIRRATDINFKIVDSLRNRLHQAIKRNYKSGSAVKDLGCTIEFLKQYTESKFYSNMSWDNWGTVWELDHIKELHTFDLTDREQFLEAVYYTNLQPLTISDHLEKTIKNR